jgi:hypothetical protein
MRMWMWMVAFVIGVAGGVATERFERRERHAEAHRTATAVHRFDVDAATQSVLRSLERQGVRVAVNQGRCGDDNLLGFHTHNSGWIDLCTDAIGHNTSSPSDYRDLLQRTILHEAVHVAQVCRMNRGGRPSVGLPSAQLDALSDSQRDSVNRSLALGTNRLPRDQAWRQEAEANALERQPAVVEALLHSAC